MSTTPPPYFSQFASPELVNSFLAEPGSTLSDPRWAESGWLTREEYAFWAWQTCGVACLQSLVAAQTTTPTVAALTKDLLENGAYRLDQALGTTSGLIYEPFATYVRARWGLSAQVRGRLPVEDLKRELLPTGRVAIASVHPSIRQLPSTRRSTQKTSGGHLVLAFGMDSEGIRFHNPSGYWPDTQAMVKLPWEQFALVYARRAVLIQL